MNDPDPRLLQRAVDDRATRPWNYYRLDHEMTKKLLNELHAKVEWLKVALHDAKAIGDFSEELRDRLRLKEAAACVPTLMAEVERLTAERGELDASERQLLRNQLESEGQIFAASLACLRQAEPGKLREAYCAGWSAAEADTANGGPYVRARLAYPDPPEEKSGG